MTNVANYALFQAAWFVCILGVARGNDWAGPVAALGIAAIHLALARRRARELALLLVVPVIGVTVDSVQMTAGVIVFERASAPLPYFIVPAWIAGQWLSFATTLTRSLAWLQGRHVLAALLGAVGGPLAYDASRRMGAVELHEERLLAWPLIGLEWAILTPLVVALAGRIAPREP